MTKELQAYTTSGLTLYTVILSATGQAWNGSAFETVAGANWTTYDVAMTEAAAGIYTADMPAAAAGVYAFVVYEQVGVDPATSDPLRGAGSIRWTGTAEEAVPPAVNVTLWSGDAVAGAPALETTAQAILEDTGTTLPALISGLSGAIVTVVSSVDGGTITVYVGDTWRFTLLSEELTLDEYEVLGLVVKRSEKQADDDALLYLRTDDGLVRIGGAAPVDAGNGTLTKTANSFTTLVHLAETQELVAGSYLWWLKAFDSSVEPSEAKTLATGGFALKRGGLQAVE